MSADLERKVREAAVGRYTSVPDWASLGAAKQWELQDRERHFEYGYLAAAALREKEIGELKAHLERANSAATANVPWNAMLHLFRLVSTMQISARKAFEFAQALVHGGMSEAELPHLLSGEPMTGDGDREAEIAAIRAQAAEAGKVRLPKVREVLNGLQPGFGISESYKRDVSAALVELDAAEGKVAE